MNSSPDNHVSSFSLGSLRVRAILLVLLAIIPLLGLTLYSYLKQRAIAITEVQRDAILVVKFVAKIQGTLLQDTNQLLHTLTQLPQVLNQDSNACNLLFARVIENHEGFTALMAATPSGHVFASAPSTRKKVDISGCSWFKDVIRNRDMVIGDPQMGQISGRYNLPLAFPVQDPEGRVTAVLSTGLDLEWLGKFISQTGLPSNSTILMVDHLGKIMFRYPEPRRFIGKQLPESFLTKEIISESEGVVEDVGLDGILRLFGFARFSSASRDFYIAVGVPQAAVFAKIDQDLKRNLIYLNLVALLAMGAAWFGGGLFIVRPVTDLRQVTRRLTAGDLTVRTGPIYQKGELGLLARDYDHMADALQERDAKLKQSADELKRRLLELRAAYRELESFSYTVAHDLRTPLRSIGGFSQIMLEEMGEKLDEEGIRYLNIIQSNIKKMGCLIDDLLTLSRLGRREMRFTKIEMEDLSRSVVERLRETEPERNLQVHFHPLPPARGDRDMLRQVLENLFNNALKFTKPKEAAVIEVSGEAGEEENIYCIKDNGVGFEMEYADKLFEVFQRLHPETEFEGTGMGLAIVQRIIQRHGGRVWGEGMVGEGAKFCFSLPNQEAEAKFISNVPGRKLE